MICASTGCFENLMRRHYMNEQERKRYLEWAIPFFKATGTDLGYVHGDIFHLWHGELRRRALRNRHEGLRVFGFDPFNDIKKNGEGAWRWNSNKPEMHNYVATYFASRKEDG